MYRFALCLIVFAASYEEGLALQSKFSNKSFPHYFKFGVATSAYQSEGAWNEDGKGESIWDRFLHTRPNATADSSNADTTVDFYHRYKEDIQILKDLGVDYFRLSISWTRILPYGTKDIINWAGVAFYRSVLTELLDNGIEPMVTIYHWDLPQILQDRGGFLTEEFVSWYADYATLLFEQFGDLVKIWTTFNEPFVVCQFGYGTDSNAPGLNRSGLFDYICGHNLIKAHAKAYHIYDERFRYYQQGQIGMVIVSNWMEPGSESKEDKDAAEVAIQFMLGWFANPIFVGDYPDAMKSRVALRSGLEGRSVSRLPEFTPAEVEYIRGTYDYFGLNVYSALLAFSEMEPPIGQVPNFGDDIGARLANSPDWPKTCVSIFKVTPFSMEKLLVFVKERYNNPIIYITENGRCDFGGIEDDDRIYFIKSYMSRMRDAMEFNQVDVRRYTHWSFTDSFEWGSGFTAKFGLYQVDLDNPALPRVPKKSAYAYKRIMKTHCLVDQCQP